MTPDEYLTLKERLIEAGYSEEIAWAETVGSPKDSWTFFCEYAWVVINSGMKNQVAWGIWINIKETLRCGEGLVSSVFRHPGKAAAIQKMWDERHFWFAKYCRIPVQERLNWLQTLPWIGPITKYHLAKNLGMDVCKPDRHLMRIATKHQLTPEDLCSILARETGNRIGTVDYVIWRAANLGWI